MRCLSVCNSPRSPVGHPASLPHYGASSELIDRSSGRTETTSTHNTHRESEATTPRVTSRTYLLLGEQGPHIKRLAHLPRRLPGLEPGPLDCESRCVCISLFDLLQSLTRQPDVTLRNELRAHYFRSSDRPETRHTPHTGTTRSQLLDLHPVPTHC